MKRSRVALVLMTALALALGSGFAGAGAPTYGAGDPSDNGVQPALVEGNPTCGVGLTALKVDPVTEGEHTDGTLTVSITFTADKEKQFDWTASEGVDSVIVKGGPSANVYSYDPESEGDGSLHAPANDNNGQAAGLSHITFCYDAEPPPPPGELTLVLTHPGVEGDVDTNPVSTDHTVNANVSQDDEPFAGAIVRFEVWREGTQVEAGTGTSPTDANGDATFTYTGPDTPATDTIIACTNEDGTEPASCTDANGVILETVVADSVTKNWIEEPVGGATFSCRASLVRVEHNTILETLLGPDGTPLEPFVANDQQDPCVADSAGLLQTLTLDDDGEIILGGGAGDPGSLTVRVWTANTANSDSGNASSEVVSVEIRDATGAIVFAAYVINSQASADCGGLIGSSTVVTLTGGGEELAVSDPQTIPLELDGVGSLGTLYLNYHQETEDTVTQRAIYLETEGSDIDTDMGNPIGNVIVAEAVADRHNCAA